MKKQIQFYIALILFAWLVSCQAHSQTDQPKDNLKLRNRPIITSLFDGGSFSLGPAFLKKKRDCASVTEPRLCSLPAGKAGFGAPRPRKKSLSPKREIIISQFLRGSQLPGLISTSGKVDTIIAVHAPSRITRKIRKDQEGNLLIAAFEDVILYDGESFSKIPKPEGFPSFDAFDALEDSKGNIWIASTQNGVFCYDGKNFMQYTTDDGLAHNRTMDIHEDRAGNIWIATRSGASRYDGKSFRNFTTKEGLTHNDVSTILEDRTGKIWFGARGTTCVYDPSTSAFTEITTNDGIPFTNVWSIIEDRKNNIWIGGENGLWRYNGSSFTNFTTEFVNCVYEDRTGNIWTTSPEGTLSRYDEQSLHHHKALPVEIFRDKSMFFRVIEDEEGNIWVGTIKGIFRYDGNSISYFRDKQ